MVGPPVICHSVGGWIMTLYLDYGYDFALREIRGVRVRGRYLQGDLYLDGEYIDYIELQMQ